MSLCENLEDIYLTDVSTCNSFAGLLDDFDHSDEAHVPDFLSIERLNLEAKGISHKHLKSYILAVSCDACRAAIGKRDNKTSTVTLSRKKSHGTTKEN